MLIGSLIVIDKFLTASPAGLGLSCLTLIFRYHRTVSFQDISTVSRVLLSKGAFGSAQVAHYDYSNTYTKEGIKFALLCFSRQHPDS